MRTFKEWCDGYPISKCRPFPHPLTEEYEDDDILHFWYLCNEKSPAVKKFVAGLNDLLDECFPFNKKQTETQESEDRDEAYPGQTFEECLYSRDGRG